MLLPLGGLTSLTALRILSPLRTHTDGLNDELEHELEPAGPDVECHSNDDDDAEIMEEGEGAEAMDLEGGGPSSGMALPRSQLVSQQEPELHLHFIPMLQNLKVLVLTGITSSGLCFRHISGLPHLQVGV